MAKPGKTEQNAPEQDATGQLLPERLTVVERAGTFVVANEDDPEDWVASFTPGAHFPARAWAERMAELYNVRGQEARDPQHAPVFLGTHHPRQPEYQGE